MPQRYLNPPDIRAVRYSKNFIKTAVCELRFPALLELEAKPPRAFQKHIRKQYPIYEPQVVESPVGAGGEALRENRYLFKSSDKQWTISVKSSAISLETSKYIDFEDFFERLTPILRSAEEMIDADFFIRVGLRYINKIPMDDGDVHGWIQPVLLSPVANPVLGDVTKFACVLNGAMENGSFSMRHGMNTDEDPAKSASAQYTLDFDYYCENLEAAAVPERLKEFNRTNFALFSWCLGEKSKKLLGPGKAKT